MVCWKEQWEWRVHSGNCMRNPPKVAQPCVCSNPNQPFAIRAVCEHLSSSKPSRGHISQLIWTWLGGERLYFFFFFTLFYKEGRFFLWHSLINSQEIHHVLIVLPLEIVHFLQIWRCSKNDSIDSACFHPETPVGFCRTTMLKFQILKDFHFMRRKK